MPRREVVNDKVSNTNGYWYGSTTTTTVVADRVVYGTARLSWLSGWALLPLLEK